MKISSKSILSPGRPGVRDPPTSLSTSLSRRLRNSGSIKGGASPAMFPTAAKKRGSFENPEPSSPKVTCIGQVRVRGKKKQAKKLRTLSRRHSAGEVEVSFRKLEHPLNGFSSKSHKDTESLNLGSKGGQSQSQNQNQDCSPAQRRWVHFPVTVCEALRAIGSEFSCLIPCRTERGKEEKTVVVDDGNREGSCGAVFTRWLVYGGGERDIELIVGDEEEEEEYEEEEESVVRNARRHVFEDLEIINGRIEGHIDEGRVSICVPPKNALLLMRCRSDPVKIEAMTNRSWEPSISRNEEEDEVFVDCENQIEKDLIEDQDQDNVQQEEAHQDQELDNVQMNEANQDQELDNVQQYEMGQDQEQVFVQNDEVGQDQELDNEQKDEMGQVQEQDFMQNDEVGQDQELDNEQKDEVGQDQEQVFLQNDEVGQDQEQVFLQNDEVGQDQEFDNEQKNEVGIDKNEVGEDQEQEQIEVEEESFYLVSLFEEITNQDYEIQEEDDVAEIGATMVTELSEICETHEEERVNEAGMLPECLLMMIHEPKLSINVSKETWVCSTDFRKPPLPPVKLDGGDESNVGFPTVLQQPARSSCSLPVAPSMATVLEQKLADAVGYEPFVLTRCKSEPMKTAASKLLTESCVWENRKLERLSRVGFGVGAAGLGF